MVKEVFQTIPSRIILSPPLFCVNSVRVVPTIKLMFSTVFHSEYVLFRNLRVKSDGEFCKLSRLGFRFSDTYDSSSEKPLNQFLLVVQSLLFWQ